MNGKFRDYKRSLPIRIALACIILAVLAVADRLMPEEEAPVAQPSSQETGLDALYKNENEALMDDLVRRQQQPGK